MFQHRPTVGRSGSVAGPDLTFAHPLRGPQVVAGCLSSQAVGLAQTTTKRASAKLPGEKQWQNPCRIREVL